MLFLVPLLYTWVDVLVTKHLKATPTLQAGMLNSVSFFMVRNWSIRADECYRCKQEVSGGHWKDCIAFVLTWQIVTKNCPPWLFVFSVSHHVFGSALWQNSSIKWCKSCTEFQYGWVTWLLHLKYIQSVSDFKPHIEVAQSLFEKIALVLSAFRQDENGLIWAAFTVWM